MNGLNSCNYDLNPDEIVLYKVSKEFVIERSWWV